MKRNCKFLISVLLAAAMIFILCACGDQTDDGEDKPSASFSDVFTAVKDAIPDADKLVDVQDSYMKNFIKANPEDYANCKVMVQSISTAIDEFGIFEAKDAAQVGEIEKLIDAYLSFYENEVWDDRYVQEEYPKLRDAERVTKGNFVMYMILGDDAKAAAITAFENATN